MAATPNVIDPYAHSHDRPRKHHVEYALTTDRASQLARARLADGDDPDAPWYCPAGAFAGSYLTCGTTLYYPSSPLADLHAGQNWRKCRRAT